MTTADIYEGMNVFSSDGEKIGTVDEIYTGVTASGAGYAPSTTSFASEDPNVAVEEVRRTPNTDQDAMADTGTANYGTSSPGGYTSAPQAAPSAAATATGMTSGDTNWFKVNRSGISGIFGGSLYIPSTAVSLISGDSVTLSCTKDQCGDLYGNKPDFLDRDVNDVPLT